MARRHEVIVVGAGFTGLAVATELAGQCVDLVLLEARGRVGGRVESAFNALGERVDTGGQFLCQDMPELMRLAARHGKTLVATPVGDDFIVQPSLPPEAAHRLHRETVAIRERMDAIAPDDPGIARLTVAAWLERQDDGVEAKRAFRSLIEGLWCQGFERIPLWHLIDNDRRATNEVSELQYFLGETMHSLADDMARDLGGRVILGAPVTAIEHGPDGVGVATPAGTFEAERVVVAVPPAIAARIRYVPGLPEPLSRALGVWQSGTVIKVRLDYGRPFWRDRGLSGIVMWSDPPGLFCCDSSSDAGHAALVVFAGDPLALRWRALGEAGMRRELSDRLVAALGPQAGTFIAASFRDWCGDAWSGGGYSDLVLDIDADDAEAALRQGAGRLQFASSELSPSYPGYIEGAIVAGRIAARKVASLRNRRRA